MNKAARWRDERFFALHYDLHATADDTELGRALTPEHLRSELERTRPDWVQCDAKGHAGYTSYRSRAGSPSPGIVQDALRIHRDVTAELGLPLVVHYSGLLDTRALELHPDWAVVHVDGDRDPMKICPRSDYRDQLMIPQLLEMISDYDIDGVWVDGENWASAPCWCSRCVAAFGAQAPRDESEPGWQEWLAFHRAAVVDHVNAYSRAVHEAKPGCAVVSNGLGAGFSPDAVTAEVDWLSADSAPTISIVHNARSFDGRGLPWELMTWSFVTPTPGDPITDMKSPAHLRQEVAVSMACGGAPSIYDLPERSGHLVGWRQQRLAELGTWCRERQDVVVGTSSVPQIAVLQSERHHYLHSPALSLPGDGDIPVRGALQALLDNRQHVDLINEADLIRRGSDYPLIVVPEQEDLSRGAIDALTAYATAGGRLLVTGARAAEVMPDLIGAKPAGDATAGHILLRSGTAAIRAIGPWQPVEATTASVIAHTLHSWEPLDESDDAVITLNQIGAGRVIAVHGALFGHHATYDVPLCRALVAELCELAGPDLALDVESPAGLHVTLRTKDDRTIVHLVNMSGRHSLAPVTAHIDEVPPLGPITARLRNQREPAAVRLVPEDVAIEWSHSDGWTTVTVPTLAIHAAIITE